MCVKDRWGGWVNIIYWNYVFVCVCVWGGSQATVKSQFDRYHKEQLTENKFNVLFVHIMYLKAVLYIYIIYIAGIYISSYR